MDESFQQTIYAKQAYDLCHKYGIALRWIPKRQMEVEDIDVWFRGPMIPKLAKKIDTLCGRGQGVINANLIGQAARSSTLSPTNWGDIGTESELFQYLKQLWHTIGYFGS